MKSKNSIKRFIRITDETGRSRYVRTEAEKARRKDETLTQKLYQGKICACCKESYIPFFQFGTKRWEQSRYCSKTCRNKFNCSLPENKQRKNAARRGNTELHRKEYLQKIERLGGTLWQVGTEKDRERVRARNRKRYKRLYGKENEYTLERRANTSLQQTLRKRQINSSVLSIYEIYQCKAKRIEAQCLSKKLGIQLHVDHLLPLSRGGKEHPDNLLIMRSEANLFWSARIKKCPWPKRKNWVEPQWEPKV
tara:strand:- start:66 stop:818 length:753 start_codon:yes stop_codon:yes gene_type:complete